MQFLRQTDDPRAEPGDRHPGHFGPFVRHSHEDRTVDKRQGRKNGMSIYQNQFFGRQFGGDPAPWKFRHLLKDVVRIFLKQRAGDKTAHAVSDQNHPVETCACFRRIGQFLPSSQQRLSQFSGRGQHRHPAGIRVEPELVTLPDHRIVFEEIDHLHPSVGTGHQPVNEDHGDLARLIRFDQIQPGVFLLDVGFQHDGNQVGAWRTPQVVWSA